MCNISREYQEEQFYKLIFQFGPVIQEDISFKRRDHLKDFLPRALAPFLFSGTICAMLEEGIKKKNSVNLFEFGQLVQEEM